MSVRFYPDRRRAWHFASEAARKRFPCQAERPLSGDSPSALLAALRPSLDGLKSTPSGQIGIRKRTSNDPVHRAAKKQAKRRFRGATDGWAAHRTGDYDSIRVRSVFHTSQRHREPQTISALNEGRCAGNGARQPESSLGHRKFPHRRLLRLAAIQA